MQKRFILPLLAICIGSIISFSSLTSNKINNTALTYDENVYHGKVDPNIKNAKVYKFDNQTFTDPLYTGAQTVSYAGNNYYQNIALNHITDGSMKNIWENYTGKNVTVAVIDTGIDVDHEDFSGAISQKSAYIYTKYNAAGTSYTVYTETVQDKGINIIKNSYDTAEKTIDSHGCNTAGVIGARNNGVGTIGIAYDCTLMVLKVDLDYYSIQAAINYATTNGAKVINMSLGGYSESFIDGYGKQQEGNAAIKTFLTAQINNAYNAGVILIASAGNEKTWHKSYPACNEHVLSVGALDLDVKSKTADFSNYNSDNDTKYTNNNVDVVAPGFVVTPDYKGTPMLPNHTYCFTAGTSFSAPLVSGAAALWKEKNPAGTPSQFIECIKTSSVDILTEGWDSHSGYGRLNISSLLEITVVEGCNGNIWYILFPCLAVAACLILIVIRQTKIK